MAAVAAPPLRALGLHGWRTNAALLSIQTRRLESVLGGKTALDITYLNGPIVASNAADQSIEKMVSLHVRMLAPRPPCHFFGKSLRPPHRDHHTGRRSVS